MLERFTGNTLLTILHVHIVVWLNWLLLSISEVRKCLKGHGGTFYIDILLPRFGYLQDGSTKAVAHGVLGLAVNGGLDATAKRDNREKGRVNTMKQSQHWEDVVGGR